jgi:tRNA pseudouridine38-40 synthase
VRLLLHLAFKGTAYHGWQIQPANQSIQSVIQEKLTILTREEILVTGCGRTDAGVHARSFYAHFDLVNLDQLPSLKSINALLPYDIVVLNMYEVDEEFHARFDAISRKYIYKIHFFKDPFSCGDSALLKDSKDISFAKLEACANLIFELKEFDSFVKSNSGLETFACAIMESKWYQSEEGRMEYHIRANRFVRGMVRLIVGMCINYSLDRISMEEIRKNITDKQMVSKSWSVDAAGLSLVDIEYPEEKRRLWKSIDLRV